jgi:hypothetical protein
VTFRKKQAPRHLFRLSGSYSVRSIFLIFFDQANSPQLEALYNSGNRTALDAVLNAARLNSSTSATIRSVVDQGLWWLDTSSPYDWLTQIGRINITKTNAKEIIVPIFVLSGQNDTSFLEQAPIAAQWYGDMVYFKTSPIVLVQVSIPRSA